MSEDRKDEDAVEEKTEDVVEEKTEDVVEEKTEDVVEEKTEDTLPDIINKIREEYDMRIAEMESRHAAAIADRDAIIQQLISGNPSGNASRETFVDKINDKRTFKKW